jgi:NAD(P)-dependent dehydrogenase (short-subunit alcohol dehydrogenase family)
MMNPKTFIVTGATSGIGKAIALGLAKSGETVVIVARNAGRGEATREEIKSQTQNQNVDLQIGDLSSLASVRKLAGAIQSKYPRLDVLINDAGVFKRTRLVSVDGFELMFATNHLGPFLLTNLLLDPLKASGAGRILTVTAPSTVKPNFDDLQSEKNFNSLNHFGATKMMNLLFTFELARRLEGTGVNANAIHPGLARSKLMDESPAIMRLFVWLASAPPERVSDSIIQVATAPEFEKTNGRFLHKAREIEAPAFAHDREAQTRLWDLSVKLTGLSM